MLGRIVVLASLLFFASSCMDIPTTTYSYSYSKKSCGQVVKSCGCHGYVELGALAYTSECSSGQHQAVPCYNMGYCPQGGVPWGSRCYC